VITLAAREISEVTEEEARVRAKAIARDQAIGRGRISEPMAGGRRPIPYSRFKTGIATPPPELPPSKVTGAGRSLIERDPSR
jgi:hypothetical protein